MRMSYNRDIKHYDYYVCTTFNNVIVQWKLDRSKIDLIYKINFHYRIKIIYKLNINKKTINYRLYLIFIDKIFEKMQK